jgi:hypothetical protein
MDERLNRLEREHRYLKWAGALVFALIVAAVARRLAIKSPRPGTLFLSIAWTHPRGRFGHWPWAPLTWSEGNMSLRKLGIGPAHRKSNKGGI